MNSINVLIPGIPVPKGRPRFGGFKTKRVYTPEKTKSYEMAVGLYARRAMQGEQPFDCPFEVRCQFVFEPPKKWSRQKFRDAINGLIDCTNGVDCDNLAKAALDSANGIIYLDDKQVVSLHAVKAYGPKAHTYIEFIPRIRSTTAKREAA